ncbi:MAG: M20/M25/M40 family metallo-hydrolase [Candidatus Latescibacteria bacterium]|nr:M20/M25/M40 family metallo-hydrolase [Candidatus Latescibacterota bacterium]
MVTDIDNVLSFIDDHEVIQVARDLIAIPSITHHEGMGMVHYYQKWFKDLGIPVLLYPCENKRANFFADYGTVDNSGRYMFNGHMDTKPVDGMTIDPFAGEIRDGKLYGRGACDMKGAVAAVLCAFKGLIRAGVKTHSGITFFSDIEEEYNASGFLWARDQGYYDGLSGLISCEPSNLEVHIGNRGGFITAFECLGCSVHSGLAHLGVNAVHGMIEFITEYLKLPYLRVKNPYFGSPTVNFEKIEGGLYLAAVPDHCIACVDSRLIPETPPELVQQQVNDLIKRMHCDYGITIREIKEPASWRPRSRKEKAAAIPSDHELTRKLARAVSYATGKDAVIGGFPAGTIAQAAIEINVPAVICGPGSIAQAHSADEWVETDQLVQAARIYTAFIASV